MEKIIKVGGVLICVYALECSYIWIQSDVIQGDVRLACFVASFAFLAQALLLLSFAWLTSRIKEKYQAIRICAMSILILFSSAKVISWAQLSDDRYTLKIDPIHEVLSANLRNHLSANVLLLMACSGLGYFMIRQFRDSTCPVE